MGWDEKFLQDASNQCTNPSGQIEDCPLFNIQTMDEFSSCNITESNIPAPLAKEVAVGGATTLPGNPPIVSTGHAAGATAGASGSDSSPSSPVSSASAASKPTLSYQPGSSMASDGQYAPGAVFAAKSDGVSSQGDSVGVTIATTSTTSTAVVTPAPAMQSSLSTQSYFSTEYQTKGQEVLEVLWVEEVATVTVPSVRRRHLHKHRLRGL